MLINQVPLKPGREREFRLQSPETELQNSNKSSTSIKLCHSITSDMNQKYYYNKKIYMLHIIHIKNRVSLTIILLRPTLGSRMDGH